MSYPLQSIRVLDLTRLLPGGICTMLLADMGADIIKIEDPHGGDYARWMPPLVAEQGAFFQASNRNKRSIIIDLKHDQGRAVLYRMAAEADVLVEGFRPGVTQRLAVDYETLHEINPRLVYCSLSGWGQHGTYAQRSGHDLNYVALSGLLGGMKQPQPLGGQIADVSGAYVGVMGILAALFQRQQTDTGDYIDVSLFDSALPFAMYQMVESTVTGISGGEGGLTGGAAYYDIYTSKDGQPMALAPIETKFWQNFCVAVHRPDWIERHHNPDDQDALRAEIQAMFSQRDAAAWATLLDDADCCFSLVTAPAEMRDNPHVQSRGLAGQLDTGVPWLRSPVRLHTADAPAIGAVPAYGEHTRAVLREAGYDAAEIDHLLAIGAVAAPQE